MVRKVFLMAVLLSVVLTITAGGRKHSAEAQKAVKILKGLSAGDKSEAVNVLKAAAANDSDAVAMNALGIAYMYGIGVDTDSASAARYLQQAADRRLVDAFHNLGMMYKDGHAGVSQDFRKACHYFKQGADLHYVMCVYDLGFMRYKGLGCRQDYADAVRLFREGADADHSPCLYMLGLCYRNGYGVEQDTVRARYYLDRSAQLGYRAAIDELQQVYPENSLRERCDSLKAPSRMPSVNTSVNDMGQLAGDYRGTLVLYDWSGQYVIGEKPVRMTLASDGKTASGALYVNADTVQFQAGISADGELRFTDGRVSLNERYTDGRMNYRMDYARLDVWPGSIKGRLGLYSLSLKEPERPMYIELERDGAASGKSLGEEERYSRITASPNPFSQDLTARFELSEAVHNAEARLFNKAGVLVWRMPIGGMSAGEHRVKLSPRVKDGEYVLNIKAGNHLLRTIIVKKGGVR